MLFELSYYGHIAAEWAESLPWERVRYLHGKLADTKKEERRQEEEQAKAMSKNKMRSLRMPRIR